jgi:hypothetical protein
MEHTEHENQHHKVRIHINREPYHSPNPATGHALYALGKIPHGQELFREVLGDEEDELVDNDDETIHLREDAHFYSAEARPKEITIYVNGQKKTVTKRILSFAEIVALAFNPVPTGPNILFTVSYEDGPHANPEGSLKEGQFVKIKECMIFNVSYTDKS